MEVEIDISFHCRKSFTTSWPQQQVECQESHRAEDLDVPSSFSLME